MKIIITNSELICDRLNEYKKEDVDIRFMDKETESYLTVLKTNPGSVVLEFGIGHSNGDANILVQRLYEEGSVLKVKLYKFRIGDIKVLKQAKAKVAPYINRLFAELEPESIEDIITYLEERATEVIGSK